MTVSTELRIDVADLRRRPGTRRTVVLAAPLPDLSAGLVHVPEGRCVHGDLVVERLDEGIVVQGRVSVDWNAECSRCLDELLDTTTVEVHELFEVRPVEGETYPLDGDELDLEQMLRDALLVEFPLAPAGRRDADERCLACGRRPEELVTDTAESGADPRWDALRALDLDP